MEQVFDSELELELESSSGCESGWTLYLQHDSNIPHDHEPSVADQQHDDDEEDEDDDEDDDMSMVSDASSGPPHDFQEHQEQDEDDDDEYGNENDHVFCHPPLMTTPRKRRKILKQTSFHSHQDHFQDHDTASSPFFTTKDLKVCNKEDDHSFDYSQGHSTTYFEMA